MSSNLSTILTAGARQAPAATVLCQARRQMCLTLALAALGLQTGLSTAGAPGSDTAASRSPAGPIVVMPVAFRDNSLAGLPPAMQNAASRSKQLLALSPVCRQYLEALLTDSGIPVVSSAKADAWLKENLPDPLSPDARSRVVLQRLAVALSAKQIVFLDFFGGSVTRRARALDVLTYQLASPDVVTVWGTMEVYDADGGPVLVLDAGAQVKSRSEYKALAESVFGIALAGLCAQPLPPPLSGSVQGDVLVKGSPFGELFADDTSLAEARARQRLVQRCVARWLARPINEVTQLGPPPEGVLGWPAFRPVFGRTSPVTRLTAKRGDVIGVMFVDYPAGAARRSIVPLLGYEDEVMKQQPIGRAAAKRFQQQQDEHVARFQSDFQRALAAEGVRLGFTLKPLMAEPVYVTGALQEITAAALAERGRRNRCAFMLAVSCASQGQGREGRVIESSMYLVDVASGQSVPLAPSAWESAAAAGVVGQQLLRIAPE